MAWQWSHGNGASPSHGTWGTGPRVKKIIIIIIIPYTKFEHYGMLRLLMWKMHLLTMRPWPLTIQPPNHITSRIIQRLFPISGLNSLGSYVFEYAADKQTNRRRWVIIIIFNYFQAAQTQCLLLPRYLQYSHQFVHHYRWQQAQV